MAATTFEFRYRFWIMLAIYAAAFACWPLDKVDVAGLLNRLLWQSHCGFGFLLAAIPALLAAWLVTWSSAYLPPGVTPSPLVTAGPYARVRNPENLGTILCFLAFSLLLNRLGFLLVISGITFFVFRLIGREEALLSSIHPSQYRAYCEAVPRLLPLLQARFSGEISRPVWKAGLLGAAHLWIAAAALLTLAFSLKESLFLTVLGCALTVRVLTAKRRESSNRIPAPASMDKASESSLERRAPLPCATISSPATSPGLNAKDADVGSSGPLLL